MLKLPPALLHECATRLKQRDDALDGSANGGIRRSKLMERDRQIRILRHVVFEVHAGDVPHRTLRRIAIQSNGIASTTCVDPSPLR